MLTAPPAPLAAPAEATAVHIDVNSVVVRLALAYVCEDSGWAVRVGGSAPDGHVTVADDIAYRDIDVLVCRDDPASCQAALDAMLDGRAGSIVVWDEPEALRTAVDALQGGSGLIPQRVIALAHSAPRLSERQQRTLRLVAAGRSNTQIARGLHQSLSTTKRDIAELLERFDVTNRAALMSAAGALGYLRA